MPDGHSPGNEQEDHLINETQRRIYFFAVFALVFYFVGASFVQSFVNYPTWKQVGPREFDAYYHDVASRIVKMMVVPGLLEIPLTLALFWLRPRGLPRWPIALALALGLARFVSTAMIQLGFQGQLRSGELSPGAIDDVIRGDYLTQLFSISRALLFVWMMSLIVRGPEVRGPEVRGNQPASWGR